MERVFSETIRTADGAVRWKAGEMAAYPPGVWDKIADDLGRDLSDFTAEPGVPAAVEPEKRRGRPPKRKEMSDVADAA